MNPIRPAQLYNIITSNNINMLTQFFDTNPEFNVHHNLSIGKKLKLLEQSLESYSNDCTLYLMDKINFKDLVDKYSYEIINNSTIVFDRFETLFNEYIGETGDNNIINIFIKNLLYSSNITLQKLDIFITSFINHIVNFNDTKSYKNVLYNVIQNKINFEKFSYLIDRTDNIFNQLVLNEEDFKIILESYILKNGKSNYIIKIIEVYEKFNIDLDEFYGKIILADKNSSYLKKLNKYFKNINLNQKVHIYSNNTQNIYYEIIPKNIWKSTFTYSLVFLYYIKGFYVSTKHNKFNLFKDNNFDNQITNLLSEENFIGWENLDFYYNHNQNFCQNMFYSILFTLCFVKKEIDTNYYHNNTNMFCFFGDNNIQKEDIIQEFNNLKPFLTNNFYDKLIELNELALNKTTHYIENLNNKNNIINNFNEKILNNNNIYESNKNTIERLRIGF